MKVLTKAGVIFDQILEALFFLACLLLGFIMLAISVDVALRYTLGFSQLWVGDTTTWSLIFIAFFGVAWVLKLEGHVKVELLLDWVNPKTRALINTITSIVSAIMWLALSWYSAQATLTLFQTAEPMLTLILRPIILKAFLIAIIPVGSFLLFIQLLRRTYGYLKVWRAS